MTYFFLILNLDAVSQNSFSGKFAYIYNKLRVEMIRIAFLVASLSYNLCTLYTQPLLVMKAIAMDF